MKTGTITPHDLADRAGVHPRTIQRNEDELGLSRIPGVRRQVIYQFTGKEETLTRRIKAPYRRPGNMRLSLVPDPAFVRREITRVCGPQMETTISGCLLSLARLAEMALILDGDGENRGPVIPGRWLGAWRIIGCRIHVARQWQRCGRLSALSP